MPQEAPTYVATKKGYLNLWNKVQILPNRKASARAIANRIVKNKARYEKIADTVDGPPWFWIAAIHNLEASGNFLKYLGNGQLLTMRTTIEPRGRGPFKSFEDGAIDAMRLKGLHKIKDWDISRCLYEAERYNGWGYTYKKVNSAYVWSFTTLAQPGKYVEDHVWDANYVSEQCGVAAIFKALEELGELRFPAQEQEDRMTELRASVMPFASLVPTLARIIISNAAPIAVKAIAEAIGELTDKNRPDPTDARAVEKSLQEVDLKKIPEILAAAEDTLKELGVVVPEPGEPGGPSVLPSSIPVTTIGETPVVVQPVAPAPTPTVIIDQKDELGVVDRIFGGKYLAGLKTPIGIALYCLAWGLGPSAGGYISEGAVQMLFSAATFLVGVGVTAKLDKIISSPLFSTVAGMLLKRK